MSEKITVIHSGSGEVAYREQSLRTEDRLNGTRTARFETVEKSGAANIDVGDEVKIFVGASDSSNKVFGGEVDSYRDTDLNLAQDRDVRRGIEYECVDHTSLADRFLVAQTYSSDSAGKIASEIVHTDTSLADEGVTTANVEGGPTLDTAVFNYERAARCFDELSELTGFVWYIDDDKDLHFQQRESEDAGLDFSSGNKPYQSFEVRRTRDNYRNRQFIRAGQDKTASRTDSFVGDGTRKAFTLDFPAAQEPTIFVDSSESTVGIRGLETGQDWFWNKGERTITQSGGQTALSDGQTLEVKYRGQFPIIVQADDTTAISNRRAKEGGTGRYEAVRDARKIDKEELARDKADGLLERHASIDKKARFTTHSTAGSGDWKEEAGTGLRAGEVMMINLPQHNLDGEFLVNTVVLEDRGDWRPRWQVEALSGTQVGGWVEFFKELADAGREFVIRENEILTLVNANRDTALIDEAIETNTHGSDFEDTAVIDETITTTVNDIFVIGSDAVGDPEVIG